jgi:hypothetical protein
MSATALIKSLRLFLSAHKRLCGLDDPAAAVMASEAQQPGAVVQGMVASVVAHLRQSLPAGKFDTCAAWWSRVCLQEVWLRGFCSRVVNRCKHFRTEPLFPNNPQVPHACAGVCATTVALQRFINCIRSFSKALFIYMHHSLDLQHPAKSTEILHEQHKT